MKVDFDDLLIRRAMTELRCMSLTYKGVKIRVIEPHVLIRHKETGEQYLMAYQVSGFSESDSSGWKMFFMSGIYDATIIDVAFLPKYPKIPDWASELESVTL